MIREDIFPPVNIHRNSQAPTYREDAGIFTLGSYPRDPDRAVEAERLADDIHRVAGGRTVRVGEVLLEIAGEGDQPLPDTGEHPRSVGIVGVLPEPGEESGVLATPLVRKLARERDIDLTGVRGSGPRRSGVCPIR